MHRPDVVHVGPHRYFLQVEVQRAGAPLGHSQIDALKFLLARVDAVAGNRTSMFLYLRVGYYHLIILDKASSTVVCLHFFTWI
jgi:hypothetical protein